MLKNLISPLQSWLLSKGKCVGCGMPLSKGSKSASQNGTEKVTCKCKRIFIFDKALKKYRRALSSEI